MHTNTKLNECKTSWYTKLGVILLIGPAEQENVGFM